MSRINQFYPVFSVRLNKLLARDREREREKKRRRTKYKISTVYGGEKAEQTSENIDEFIQLRSFS